jgi:hypothetical protein
MRKKAKLLWLQNCNQMNGDRLNSITCESSRNYTDKKGNILKMKV